LARAVQHEVRWGARTDMRDEIDRIWLGVVDKLLDG
jgi:hypothetical protein